jgi:hypothetical protein
MEFWFASSKVDVAQLDALVRRYTHNGVHPRGGSGNRCSLNGMFKGFIDLTFEHDGRYYVADYKSNWLGVDDAAYTAQAMEHAILDNRYDLQYVLVSAGLASPTQGAAGRLRLRPPHGRRGCICSCAAPVRRVRACISHGRLASLSRALDCCSRAAP